MTHFKIIVKIESTEFFLQIRVKLFPEYELCKRTENFLLDFPRFYKFSGQPINCRISYEIK